MVVIQGSDDFPTAKDRESVAGLYFENLIRVKNGDEIEVQVQVEGETYRGTYEVSCNQSDNAENSYFFRIRHPGSHTDTGEGMEFSGSRCGV
jgi:hypothetical protein